MTCSVLTYLKDLVLPENCKEQGQLQLKTVPAESCH